jgi:glycosyltransferase involved in cell wall biosynthesis
MRVAIDATPLTLSSGGLRRYTLELSAALAENFPQDEFFLASDQPFHMPESALSNLQRGGGPRDPAERRWWLWGLNRELQRLGAELFHGTDFAVPYITRRPSILTLHDLSPWMNAAWHSDAARVRQRTPLLIALGLPAMIVTPSEAVRKQAIERFRIHPDRIRAIPHAASACFRPVRADAAPPYFLFAGTLEPRKNIPGLVAAWREVRRSHPVDLVLVGRQRPDFAQLSREPGLRIMGEVPDDRLAQLLAGALAFVYPSFYEGFGLPVLEAMQCGACVITSRDAAITEVAGGAAIQAGSQEELVQAMREIAADPERAVPWRERGLRRAADFSWRRTAEQTHELYEDVLRDRREKVLKP